jgi:hypothetical protein
MIIQSSNVGMNSKHRYSSIETASTSLSLWSNFSNLKTTEGISLAKEGNSKDQPAGNSSGGNSFSDSMDDIINRFKESQRVNAPKLSHTPNLQKTQLQIMDYFLKLLFGKDCKVVDNSSENEMNNDETQGVGGHYEDSYFYSESESTSFQTTGTAVTADGRKLDFNVNVSMSHTFMEYANTTIDFGSPQMIDPLVINLDNNVASVSDQTFLFDMDADGKLDKISNLGAGSSYLALDKNGDGKINDGSELFGTKSGNGFADLAKYDTDGNGWIDEADDVFNKLRIWSKDEDGNDKLIGLGKAGVGAIYLGSANTEFSLKSAKDNSTNAVIRSTGLFLYENGRAGTIQHVDVAKDFSAKS